MGVCKYATMNLGNKKYLSGRTGVILSIARSHNYDNTKSVLCSLKKYFTKI